MATTDGGHAKLPVLDRARPSALLPWPRVNVPSLPDQGRGGLPRSQTELDLLAEGRDALERWTTSVRFRYLYPQGPNLAVVLRAYQQFDRLRAVGRIGGSPRRQARRLTAMVRRLARRDAVARHRRLRWRYPQARLRSRQSLPPIVVRALGRVDPDARPLVSARLDGTWAPPDPAATLNTEAIAEQRGLDQFREALINEALAHPHELAALHPQFFVFAASPPPLRRRYPIASYLLVKLPLQLVLGVFALLALVYVGAFLLFNDQRLGRFVSTQVSGLVEGELQMESIHWELRLIVDLLTGTPSHVVVDDVSVWEPYASYGGERTRRTAYAPRIEADLVLHEIIPWNRLGVPQALEVPWLLHFSQAQASPGAWISVREYDAVDDEGNTKTLLSLLDAFAPVEPGDPDRKGLSFVVEDTHWEQLELDVNFMHEGQGWRVGADVRDLDLDLRFDAPQPTAGVPVRLPLRFSGVGQVDQGVFQLDDIGVPLEQLALRRLACGMDDAPLGDVAFAAEGLAAGSPLTLSGTLADAFTRRLDPPNEPLPAGTAVRYGDFARVQLRAGSDQPRALVRHLERQLDLPPQTITADRATVWAQVNGPLDDPSYQLAAQGLALDLMGEPAWTMDDVELSIALATAPVPLRWQAEYPERARRLVARFETFRGAALDGAFALDANAERGAVVVFPEGDEPYRIAAPLALDGVNPAQLLPDDPQSASMLAGDAEGTIDLRLLELGPLSRTDDSPPPPGEEDGPDDEPDEADSDFGLRVAQLDLADFRLTRDHGPASDSLPRRLRADGLVTIDETGAIDLDQVIVRTDGTELRATGGVDGKLSTLAETSLALDINDGRAFSRAFGLDPYFDSLRASLTVLGPVGAPNGGDGRLVVSGVSVQEGTTTQASMWLDRGVLKLNAPRAHLFGGVGTIDAQITLFERGTISNDPKLRATIDLAGIDLERLADLGITGTTDVRIEIGDAEGNPVPLSALEIRGSADVVELQFGGSRYRHATLDFQLDPQRLQIDRLVLPVVRPVSPFRPDVTVPIGELRAQGTVGLQDDPALDLQVQATGVPLRLLARLLEVEMPLRGRIDAGTSLAVQGTVRRPSVRGQVALTGLVAEGVELGSGVLEVTSDDLPAAGRLAPHRELRVTGELSTGNQDLQWTVDALVALGEPPRRAPTGAMPPIDAQVDVRVARVSLPGLLRGLGRGDPDPMVLAGRLDGLSAHVLTCDPSTTMISDCSAAPTRSLEVSLRLDGAWVAGREPTTEDPCDDPVVLCTQSPLAATIEGNQVELSEPWRWATGGGDPATLALTGSFDLSGSGDASRDPSTAAACEPPAPATRQVATPAPGMAHAELHGALDLAVLAELAGSEALRQAEGRLDVHLVLDGPLAETRLSGRVTLPEVEGEPPPPLHLDLDVLGTPMEVADLDIRIGDQWLTAQGDLRVLGESIEFGSVRGAHTGFAIGGECVGHYGVAVHGTVGARLVNALLGPGTATKGSVEIPQLVAQGDIEDEHPLDYAAGSLRFGRNSLSLALVEGLPTVELVGGRVDVVHCAGGRCPADIAEGSLALHVGGDAGAKATRRPSDALRAKIGPRGSAAAWGTTYLVPQLDNVDGTRLVVELEDVPYREYDHRGRPVYEVEASSPAVQLQGGSPLVVSGDVDVDRARYVQDAVQGVEILRFTDDVDLPSAPPPDIIRDLQFDLRVQTRTPLRVENNVAHGVEANAVVDVTGTYQHPEFTGRVDVEPGGTVDIPFLTGTYEIQRGRVTLLRELADAEVDVLALRRELVYIDDTPRQVYLLLGGTASAITWQCIAEGDTSGAVDTQRGCLDYLVLGAGDVQDSSLTVQRTGGGGLANARKPLQVVGHVTEFDLGRRIEEAAPRFGPYVPDMRLRLGQIGPELEVATPSEWLDFDYVRGTAALDYTRGYPGFLLRQSRDLTFKLEAVDTLVFEVSRDVRSYLNNRIIFDPLRQTTVEFRVDFEIPSLR